MRLLAHGRGEARRSAVGATKHGGGEDDDRRRDLEPRAVDLAGPVIFIRSDNYHEIAGPDWALHLETSLGEGDEVHVAGPVMLAPGSATPAAPPGWRLRRSSSGAPTSR